MNTKAEGSIRLLTSGEVRLARKVFKDTIPYHKVWVHHDSYLPFGMQNKSVAMAPNGELYFRALYQADFSVAELYLQRIFIHELSHVWQREHGMNVIGRGIFSWAVSYRYRLDGRSLKCYPMEQQAQIIADYFMLNSHGYSAWHYNRSKDDVSFVKNIAEDVVRQQYQKALRHFPWGL